MDVGTKQVSVPRRVRVVQTLSLAIALLGLFSVLSWSSGTSLGGLLGGAGHSIKPATSLALIFAGLSLWSATSVQRGEAVGCTSLLLALFAAIPGVWGLVEYFSGSPGHTLAGWVRGTWPDSAILRPSQTISLNVAMISGAVLTARFRVAAPLSQTLGFAGAMVGIVAVSQLFPGQVSTAWEFWQSVDLGSLATWACLIAMSMGSLMLTREAGFLEMLGDPDTTGPMLRRIAGPLMLMPVMMLVLRRVLGSAGVNPLADGMTAAGITAALVVFFVWHAYSLRHSNAERRRTAEMLSRRKEYVASLAGMEKVDQAGDGIWAAIEGITEIDGMLCVQTEEITGEKEVLCRHGLEREDCDRLVAAVPRSEERRTRLAYRSMATVTGSPEASTQCEVHSQHVLNGFRIHLVLVSRSSDRLSQDTWDYIEALDSHMDQFIARKRAELERGRASAYFQRLVECLPAVVYRRNAEDGGFSYISPQVGQLLGETPASLTGDRDLWTRRVHPEDRPRLDALAAEIRERGQGSVEYRILKTGGTTAWVLDRATRVPTGKHAQEQIQGVLFDLSELRQTQEAFEEAKGRYEALFQQSTRAVAVFKATSDHGDFLFRDVNQAAERIEGWGKPALVGRRLTEVLPSAVDGGLLSVFRRVLRSGTAETYPLALWKEGKLAGWREYLVYRLPTGDLVAIYDDISERKRAEEQIQKAMESAQIAERTRREFMANLTHEIRTPLNGIVGYCHMITDGPGTPDHKVIGSIRSHADHLARLIDRMLELADMDVSRPEPTLGKVDLAELVAEVKRLVQPRALEKQLQFVVETESGLPQVVTSDRSRLREILLSLLEHAIAETQTGSVRLTMRQGRVGDDDMLIFDVTDTGRGLQSPHSVFEPFGPSHAGGLARAGTLGLGLALSKRFAQILGGNIDVTSHVGLGTTFKVSVPLRVVVAGQTGTPARGAAGGTTPPKLRALVVDDALDNQILARFFLTKLGYDVELAENGQVAVEKAQHHIRQGGGFDLVLMDVQMPVMDGHQATRALRDMGVTWPIIAVTANSLTSDRAKCLECGCDDYLPKPIDAERLKLVIGEATQKRSAKV